MLVDLRLDWIETPGFMPGVFVSGNPSCQINRACDTLHFPSYRRREPVDLGPRITLMRFIRQRLVDLVEDFSKFLVKFVIRALSHAEQE